MGALTGRVLAAVLGSLGGFYGGEVGWTLLSGAFVVALFALVFWDIAQNIAERRRSRSRGEGPRLRSKSSYVASGALLGILVSLIGQEDVMPPDPLVWVAVWLIFLLWNLTEDWRKVTGNPGMGAGR